MMRSLGWWLVVTVLTAACGEDRPLVVPSSGGGSSTPQNGGGTFKAASDASVTMSAKEPTVVVAAPAEGGTDESATSEIGDVATGLPRSCDELAAGGVPDELVDFAWQEQTGSCSSSACVTFVWIKDGCTLEVQRDDVRKTFSMTSADCAAARGWATNARFLDVIRDGTGCANGATPESFELTLTQDAPRRKTWGCDEPVVVLERGCFGALAARLYPPR